MKAPKTKKPSSPRCETSIAPITAFSGFSHPKGTIRDIQRVSDGFVLADPCGACTLPASARRTRRLLRRLIGQIKTRNVMDVCWPTRAESLSWMLSRPATAIFEMNEVAPLAAFIRPRWPLFEC